MNKILLTGLALLVSSCATTERNFTHIEPQAIYEMKCQDREKDSACYQNQKSLVVLEYRF